MKSKKTDITMAEKKTLQKLSKSSNEITTVADIYSTKDHIQVDRVQALYNAGHLTDDDLDNLLDFIVQQLNELKGTAKDQFIEKFNALITPETRNELWEINHTRITYAMSSLQLECGRMPTVTEIATKTGISRQTVTKHLKEYRVSENYKLQEEQLKLLKDKVIGRLYDYSMNGNVKAAKLFLEATGSMPAKQTTINTQNNYIQINSTILTQETIERMPEEKLIELEQLVQTALVARMS